ncbi:Hypothetical predicted protein [Pelobates cultripes]|uniref:Endonuclease/exonuclease/phosphatase domain-containing protein n=1 Tax=Pelobates cultripes TaxID=61616 RepID=A0AAD1WKL5_PELCU|nr:Hypothetical predicted protein [Pelobates cultripes]
MYRQHAPKEIHTLHTITSASLRRHTDDGKTLGRRPSHHPLEAVKYEQKGRETGGRRGAEPHQNPGIKPRDRASSVDSRVHKRAGHGRGTPVPDKTPPLRRDADKMAYRPDPLKIITQNCRRLNLPERRTNLLRELQRERVAIALLQETHFREGAAPTLKNKHYPTNYYGNHPTAKKAGVAILIAARLQFQEQDRLIDHNGRYAFVKGNIAGRCYTFATIYVPNNQSRFLKNTLKALTDFTEGTLIAGGDFNVTLDPKVDSSTGHSSILQREIRTIHHTLKTLRLVDCWRTLNPLDREYTHYSTIHKRYSRIDFLLLQQEALIRLRRASIHAATWSDHGQVSMDLESPLIRPTKTTWRLNDSLLTDLPLRAQVTDTLQTYFTENETRDVSDMTVWEAHKSVLRGKLIQIASQRKREAGALMSNILDRIRSLETQNKRQQVEDTYKELLEERRRLHAPLLKRHLRQLRRSKGFFYLHANKGGKLLAQMLRGQQHPSQVHKLKTRDGTTTQHPEKIAKEFLTYYSSLYNTHSQSDEEGRRIKRDRMECFLREHLHTTVTAEDAETIDRPITEDDIKTAIKTTKTGRATGPDGLTLDYYKRFQDILAPKLTKPTPPTHAPIPKIELNNRRPPSEPHTLSP